MNRRHGGGGLAFAALSAATFGTSGTFATSLIESGWTPAAAVTVRITLAAVLLTVPALLQMRGRWGQLRRGARLICAYGLVAVAGCQLCYFNAVRHLSVGVALLLEYLGIVLVVGWLWARHGQRPRRLTIGGVLAAVVGLALVLDLTGSQHIDGAGVLWGLGAAVGLATFFTLSSATADPLPPIAMAWAGMSVGSVALLGLAAVGVLPMRVELHDVQLLHAQVSWLVPAVGLSLVAAVIAYVVGIAAARRLGAKLASFVGLTEVLFAVLFAWLLLGQLPGDLQIVGGLFIVAGVALVRIDELQMDKVLTAEAANQTDTPSTPHRRRNWAI